MTGVPVNETVEQAIAQALGGQQVGFTTLYELFNSGVYRLCYSLLFNSQDAEDVTQDAFIYAFRNLSRFDANRANFRTWLYTIAVSRARNVHRRKRPVAIDFATLIGLPLPAPLSETPEAVMALTRAQEAVSQAILSLSPRLREVIILRYGHGLTYREIADVVGCPHKTAESRVRLAHDRLRRVLQEDGRSLLEEVVSLS